MVLVLYAFHLVAFPKQELECQLLKLTNSILPPQAHSNKVLSDLPFIMVYADDILVFTPQMAGFACQLGCPKIVLDHVHVL